MSQVEYQNMVTIVEAREEEMVSHTGGIPTLRLARFLKPTIHEAPRQAQAPLLPKTHTYNFKQSLLTVDFKGWRFPQRKWKQWVDNLKPSFGEVWKRTGIYDSIMLSTCKFRKDKDLILGLAELWCADTNTFVFSWGEATVTLEDMLILGGLPIIGESVTSPLKGELVEIEEKMIQEYKEIISVGRVQRAQHNGWIKWFMGYSGELEHTAFLILWLSRYIFPSEPYDTIHTNMFPIAIHLSKATPIALAPAVLASIYKDLRALKEQIDESSTMEYCTSDDLSVTVWAPFQVMQLWAWERFPSLQPNAKYLISGEPRAARWHDLTSKSKLKLVRRTLNSADCFQWRPYSCILDNWQHPLYSKEQVEWVVITPNTDARLLSFSHCFVPCELVGLDCNEQYLPYRVGMQFGMDQDIPDPFARINANLEIFWRTFRKIVCYIPPRLFESDVTAKYFQWWNQSYSTMDNKAKSNSIQQTSSSGFEVSLDSSESEISPSMPPTISRKLSWDDQSSSDEDKMLISEWYKRRHANDNVPVNDRAASSSVYLSSSQVVGSSSAPHEQATQIHWTKSLDNDLYNKASKKSENSSSQVVCSSSTPNENAMRLHWTKSSDNDVYNEASKKSENSSSLVMGSSSTPNENGMQKHWTKSIGNKASMRNESSSQEDMDVRSNICSESDFPDVTNQHEIPFPGPELEDRIENLEAIVNMLKMQRRRTFRGTKTRVSNV